VGLRLRPFRDDELPGFVERGTAQYVRDLAENAGLSREQAEAKAERDWAQLLPGGRVQPDHFLYAIEDELTGEQVGDLWYAKRSIEFEGTFGYVYAIEIRERFRGFGRRAMLLLEDDVRAAGLTAIALNVFGGNEAARSLYLSLGYAEAAVWMRKRLG